MILAELEKYAIINRKICIKGHQNMHLCLTKENMNPFFLIFKNKHIKWTKIKWKIINNNNN